MLNQPKRCAYNDKLRLHFGPFYQGQYGHFEKDWRILLVELGMPTNRSDTPQSVYCGSCATAIGWVNRLKHTCREKQLRSRWLQYLMLVEREFPEKMALENSMSGINIK